MRLQRPRTSFTLAALVAALSVFLVGVVAGLAARRPAGEGALAAQASSESLVQLPDGIAATVEPAPATAPPASEAPATTAAPATTVAAPVPTTAQPPATAAPAATVRAATVPPKVLAGSTTPFRGMGTWVDVFDWSPTYTKGSAPKITADSVDAMAAQGVQVLYIQTARADWTGAGDIVDPGVLEPILARARARGLRIVAWYLPFFTDLQGDLRRLVASAALPGVSGVGVDIEDTKHVPDDADRSNRLVQLSQQVRQALAGRPLSAITLPNVVTDVINTKYWPGFPWAAIRSSYDAWQPMGYWTNRTAASGWRDAHRYTYENVVRLRAALGDPKAVVSPVGGIGDQTTAADVQGYLQAVRETGCIGASLYDWSTQKPETYAPMATARA